jgi:hypothetical protein
VAFSARSGALGLTGCLEPPTLTEKGRGDRPGNIKMRVVNVHERILDGSVEQVGRLIDGLASPDDPLWPIDRWVPMQFDRPLGIGAAGGHGPIRYTVESYEPGCNIRFRFTEPKGFLGTHRFEVEPAAAGKALLRHVIEMQVSGRALFAWLIIRPLHDALLEDALDRAEASLGRQMPPRQWSCWVRLVRRIIRRREDAKQKR